MLKMLPVCFWAYLAPPSIDKTILSKEPIPTPWKNARVLAITMRFTKRPASPCLCGIRANHTSEEMVAVRKIRRKSGPLK